jgi:hypothetical protein
MESTNKTIQGDLKQATTCTPNNQCTDNQKGTKQQQNNNKKQKTQTAAPILKKPTTQADPSSTESSEPADRNKTGQENS